MARINIEDQIFVDPRFKALARKLGCEDAALGMVIRLWKLGQEYWKHDRGLIPYEVFDIANLDDAVECLLAERRDEGVYVRGAEEQFAWLVQRVEAGKKGGERSVASRTKQYGSSDPKLFRPRSDAEAVLHKRRSGPEAAEKPPTLTPPLSLTHTQSLSLIRGDASRELSPERKLRIVATNAIRDIVNLFNVIGRDGESAKRNLDPLIWKILEMKFPNNTWGNFATQYEQAAKRGASQLWEKDMRVYFEDTIAVIGGVA